MHAVDRAKNEKEIHLASRGDQEEGGPKEGRTVIADHATARTDSQNAKIIMSLKAYPKLGFNNVHVLSPMDISNTGWPN